MIWTRCIRNKLFKPPLNTSSTTTIYKAFLVRAENKKREKPRQGDCRPYLAAQWKCAISCGLDENSWLLAAAWLVDRQIASANRVVCRSEPRPCKLRRRVASGRLHNQLFSAVFRRTLTFRSQSVRGGRRERSAQRNISDHTEFYLRLVDKLGERPSNFSQAYDLYRIVNYRKH